VSTNELAQAIVEDALWPDAKVRRRYGVSEMTIWRWDRKPELGFPKPVWINGRKYRRVNELLAWEQSAARKHASDIAGKDT
jgi:predicted DNA-binding transcriptional regulator AlpA